MSKDVNGTLEALAEDAAPALRTALREALRRAYEAGYREALASGRESLELPNGVSASARGPEDRSSAPAAAVAGGSVPPSLDWEAEEASDASSRREPAPPRIFPHATIGTLHERIVRTFDLERFDIDVVLCRKGDRARRQLKHTATLSTYMTEG